MRGSCTPPVAFDDGGGELGVVVDERVSVSDGLLQAAQQVLVDLLVGGQQKNLVAGVGEVAVDEMLAVAAVETAQRRVDDAGQPVAGHPHQTPEQRDSQKLAL